MNEQNENKLNVESLYQTLALIIGRKNNVKVSVKVSQAPVSNTAG